MTALRWKLYKLLCWIAWRLCPDTNRIALSYIWDEGMRTCGITWTERVANLRNALGRAPTLDELLNESRKHKMTPEEINAQRASLARGMMPVGDPRFD